MFAYVRQSIIHNFTKVSVSQQSACIYVNVNFLSYLCKLFMPMLKMWLFCWKGAASQLFLLHE